ncbi:unnamed protein product [Cuscuta campestris]|uniref:Uncharacterized protein n=1 Tax=Cuscuta campestris TaxID=132261 RepID=A0A484N5S3_9ASTE|nr:unnamed protein product [Cuscuta campestris]
MSFAHFFAETDVQSVYPIRLGSGLLENMCCLERSQRKNKLFLKHHGLIVLPDPTQNDAARQACIENLESLEHLMSILIAPPLSELGAAVKLSSFFGLSPSLFTATSASPQPLRLLDSTKVFYIDRVVLYSRDVERMLPAFLGWTSKILRDREKKEVRAGGFGLGYDDGRFVGEVMDVSSGDTVVGACLERVNVETGNGDAAEPMGEPRDDPVEVSAGGISWQTVN